MQFTGTEADGSERGGLLIVSDETVVKLRLRVGMEVSPDQAGQLNAAARVTRARDLAIGALATRSRSVRDLELYLRRRGVAAPDARAEVSRLGALGLLDDSRFAEGFVRSRLASGGASAWRLRRDLARKGVARDIADRAIADVMTQESVDERDLAEREARKKWRTLARLDAVVARRRLMAFLQRRGFGASVIREAVRAVSVTRGEP